MAIKTGRNYPQNISGS